MTLHTGRHYAKAFASLIFLFCISCRSVVVEPQAVGKGLVNVALQSEIIVKSAEAVSEDDYLDYNIRFVGVDGYATSEYMRFGDVEWPMEWYFGTFRLQAESCTIEQADAGYGTIRYEGLGDPFYVDNGRTAQTSVTCTMANVLVNVNFNDKMFLSFKNFMLSVTSVLAPVYEKDDDGEDVLVRGEQAVRTLEFNALDKSGYYSLSDEPMHLKYVLYVMMDGADEFVEHKTGYLLDVNSQPAFLRRSDYVTFNVNYVGDVMVTEDIKFIISGERHTMSNGFGLDDYVQGTVKPDN